ncbi:MAG: hypothetical protein OEZ47_00170 [Gammaproteobacteria bacterium]|nr:hypothetical protein [Gammaproteobacteria bacterium]
MKEKDSQENLDVSRLDSANRQVDQSRRRLTKSALVLAPVVLTLANKPAWAGKCTLSGQLSGNLSHHGDEPCGGEGCSTSFWQLNTDQWHAQIPPEALFDTVFQVEAFPGLSLLQTLGLSNDPNVRGEPPAGCALVSSTEAHAYQHTLRYLAVQSVAALQNAATPVNFDLTVEQVISNFRNAYHSCDPEVMKAAATTLDQLNSQLCPLGGAA